MPASPARSEPEELALDTLVSPSGGLLLQEIPDDNPPHPPAPLAEALSSLALGAAKRPSNTAAAGPSAAAGVPIPNPSSSTIPLRAPSFIIDDALLVEPSSVDELLDDAPGADDDLLRRVRAADDAELMWDELLDTPGAAGALLPAPCFPRRLWH